MAMSQSTLGSQLQNMTPVSVEATAAQTLAAAWQTYFSAAMAGAVPFSGATGAQSAMQAALAGMSAPGAGAAAIQAGITAFWAALVASPAVYFTGATLITPPPTLSAIAAALAPVFAANVTGQLSLADSCTAIAGVLHPNNLGGTATLPGPVVVPIA